MNLSAYSLTEDPSMPQSWPLSLPLLTPGYGTCGLGAKEILLQREDRSGEQLNFKQLAIDQQEQRIITYSVHIAMLQRADLHRHPLFMLATSYLLKGMVTNIMHAQNTLSLPYTMINY